MTKKTIACVECGERVPYGRLSCPACGAPLAAASGMRRAPDPPTPMAAAPAYLVDPATPTHADPEIETWRAPWPPLEAAQPALVARSYGWGPSSDADDLGRGTPPPGAYLPPSLAISTTMTAAADRSSTMPAAGAVSAVSGGSVGTAVRPAAAAGALPGVDAARLVEIAGWFIVVGSAMAVLGFMLPWSVAVIGARSAGGYLDGWGLASPSHVLVLAGLLGVLALGVVRTWVPAWFRTGVLGLGIGGLLIGLTWPYVLGPLGADVGVLVTTIGGLVLVIGGGVASWATRHAGTDPLV